MKAASLVVALALFVPAVAADEGRPRGAVDPSALPCAKDLAEEIAPHVGAPARIRETDVDREGAGHCVWIGSRDGVTVRVAYLPGKSLGVPAGEERAHFDATMRGRKARFGSAFAEVPGLADAAWSLDPADNPQRVVSLFKAGNMAVVTTTGLDLTATIDLARAAASRM